MRRVFQFERLRNSPTNNKNINLYLNNFKLFIKLINVRLNKLYNLSIFNYSTTIINNNKSNKINPNWITGFVDAEGCFSVIIEIFDINASHTNHKWRVRTSFEINLHIKDVNILYKIQSFFGVGAVYLRPYKKLALYRVSNIEYLRDIIIPHFNKYPLITQKYSDFYLWKKVIQIILNKEHLNKSGFLTILTYYASINRGIYKKVLKYYPNINPVKRISVKLPYSLNPFWVSGFTSGDGGFSIIIRPSISYIFKEQVSCRFHIAQHIRDIELMNLFSKFFNCGSVYLRFNSKRCDFVVQDINLLLTKIIPHFELYPIFNLKYKDYSCFKNILDIIKLKQHLSPEGLEKIKNIKLEMNSNRLK
jgi:LAGLIDADG endonuclease